ncbi:TRNA pseudouridine synthase [Aphelenchoides fujianensis]|nr:TRNA pseudouridine synthase [Aphelenchoides fujianensis]
MFERYVLWIAFNGSRFNGMAKTGNVKAVGAIDFVNAVVPHVLRPLGVETVQCSPGSRTDTGVHVLRAPIMMNLRDPPLRLDCGERKAEILRRLNSVTADLVENPDLKFLDLHRVSNGFSLRTHVSYRRYVYRFRVAKNAEVYERLKQTPTLACLMEKERAWTRPAGFRSPAGSRSLPAAHRHLQHGFLLQEPLEHVAASPPPRRSGTPPSARWIWCESRPEKPWNGLHDEHFDYFNFEVISRSFLRQQIRRMARVVYSYARGRIGRDVIRRLFDYPHPNTFIASGLTPAPGHALYLVDVVYDPDQFENPVPSRTAKTARWPQELDGFMNKTVSVIAGDGRNFVGMMKGFDQTINIILEGCHERVYSEVNGITQIPAGVGGDRRAGRRAGPVAWIWPN